MQKEAKITGLARMPAWAMSFITVVVLFILLSLLNEPDDTAYSTIQIAGYIFTVIWITGACFFICRIHPKSVWYTPVICNVVSIIGVIMYIFTDYAPLSEVIFWLCTSAVSVIGAIVGAKLGLRRTNHP